MAKKKVEEPKIFQILKEYESGIPMKELSRKYGFTEQTLYRWRNKYGGMELSDIQQMKDLERENSELKKIVANMALENTGDKKRTRKKVLDRPSKLRAIDLLNKEGISKRRSLKLLDFPKSTYYFKPKIEDELVVNEIRRLAFKRKRAGYRMIYESLRKAGWRINHKKVYRLYSKEGLKIRTKPRKKRKLADSKPIPIPNRANQVWAIDFLHERTMDGRKARILSGVDLCTRENVVLFADYSISSERLIRFLETLPELPKSFITDNGPEFTSKAFLNWLTKTNISISYIDPGKPTQNAFVESFNGTLRAECMQLSFCRDLTELRSELSKFQKDYNEERLHSSLNYLTPLEFKAKYGS